MAFTVDVIIGAVEHSLTDGSLCYFQGDDGLGMSPLHRLIERGPLQHGETDRGFRLDPRFFRLFLDVEGSSWENLWTKRNSLLDIFRPTNDPVIVRWTFDPDAAGLGGFDSTIRQIDAFLEGDMKMPSSRREAFAQKVVVGLKANDPTFYDPTAIAVTFQLGGASGSNMPVPSEVPTEIGGSTIDQSTAVNYTGNVQSYPVIRVTGPITDPVITNNTIGLGLDFTGTTIAGGDYYDIDLRYGEKSVEDSSGDNQLADLVNSSDFATWRLETSPDAPSGINSINVAGTAATSSTKVELTYWVRYIGI